MPQVFKVGSYWVYFWSNEGEPMEPIHVHVSKGRPSKNAAKIWLTKSGGCILASNPEHISSKELGTLLEII